MREDWIKSYSQNLAKAYPKENRERVARDLYDDMMEYLECNPAASEEDIRSRFGSVEKHRKENLISLDEETKIKRMRFAKKALILVALAVVLGCVIFFCLGLYEKGHFDKEVSEIEGRVKMTISEETGD